jgi:hypothetical protein
LLSSGAIQRQRKSERERGRGRVREKGRREDREREGGRVRDRQREIERGEGERERERERERTGEREGDCSPWARIRTGESPPPGLPGCGVCVCVCVCARARACVLCVLCACCVCCVRGSCLRVCFPTHTHVAKTGRFKHGWCARLRLRLSFSCFRLSICFRLSFSCLCLSFCFRLSFPHHEAIRTSPLSLPVCRILSLLLPFSLRPSLSISPSLSPSLSLSLPPSISPSPSHLPSSRATLRKPDSVYASGASPSASIRPITSSACRSRAPPRRAACHKCTHANARA